MRILDFSDGFTSSSAPTTTAVTSSGLKVYANDAAFESAEGTAVEGDCYFNSADNFIHVYDGSTWRVVADSTQVQTLTGKIFSGGIFTTTYDMTHTTTPSNPSAGFLRVYAKNDNTLYTLTSGGVESAVGSGGGGGGTALRWVESVNAPTAVVENNLIVYEFDPDTQQEIYAMVKVPQSYVAGTQAFLYFDFYSAGTSDTVYFKVLSTLIRPGTDLVTSVTNQQTSAQGAVTLVTGDMVRNVAAELTSASGQINLVSIAPGDRIFLKLFRDVANDTSTVVAKAMLDGSEVTFA